MCFELEKSLCCALFARAGCRAGWPYLLPSVALISLFPSVLVFLVLPCCHRFTLHLWSLFLAVSNFSSVQFSRSVVSDSLQPHESQHARPPCPSPTPRVHSDSRPSSQRCHSAISSSVVPFSSNPQSLPASESLPMSQLFAWGGQSTGVSALASFLPISFRMDWLDLLAVQGTLKSLLQHHSSKASILRHSAFFTVQLSHPYTFLIHYVSNGIQSFISFPKSPVSCWPILTFCLLHSCSV